jgi:hypothetical protein
LVGFRIALVIILKNVSMAKTTEVFYYNKRGELQKIGFYNTDGFDFVRKVNKDSIRIFCVIEDGTIVYTSREFQVVEDSIDRLLGGLMTQSN